MFVIALRAILRVVVKHRLIKRLGYLSAFKLLKKVDIKRPNYKGKCSENVGMVFRGIKRP